MADRATGNLAAWSGVVNRRRRAGAGFDDLNSWVRAVEEVDVRREKRAPYEWWCVPRLTVQLRKAQLESADDCDEEEDSWRFGSLGPAGPGDARRVSRSRNTRELDSAGTGSNGPGDPRMWCGGWVTSVQRSERES